MVAKFNSIKKQKKSRVSCIICGKKRKNIYGNLCSSTCAHLNLDYNAINIPRNFIKNVFIHCIKEEEQIIQLKNYANRHNYDEKIVLKKAKDLFKIYFGENNE